MSATVGTVGTSGAQATGYDAFNNLGVQDFITLLVTELQQQDPMEPMDNAQILQQVSQIRQIQSDTQLSDTMSSVALGQNVATASSLIDRQVLAMDDSGNPVVGTVKKVSIENGTVNVYVGDKSVSLKNIAQILSN
jgi:flagellar basal-body rod modification protein FlgD